MKKFLVLCAMLLALSGSAFGKGFSGGRSGGGFRSSSGGSSFKSSPKPSAPKVSPPSSSRSGGGFTAPKANPVSPSTAPKPVPKTVVKPVEKPTPQSLSQAKTVALNGKTMSRDQAVSDFKAKNASTYTSKYSKEPAARPTHIPTSTSVGGSNVNITYNSTHGGYGYMHPSLGTWMMYDVMSDAIMMNSLMHSHGYAATHTTTVYDNPGGTTVVTTRPVGFSFFWTFIVLVMVTLGVIIIFNTLR